MYSVVILVIRLTWLIRPFDVFVSNRQKFLIYLTFLKNRLHILRQVFIFATYECISYRLGTLILYGPNLPLFYVLNKFFQQKLINLLLLITITCTNNVFLNTYNKLNYRTIYIENFVFRNINEI